MALVSQCKCEHPKLIHNKYTGKDVFVACRECISCKRAITSAWVAKLQQESKCHLYTFELELDYNDSHLPRYDYDVDTQFLVEVTPRLRRYYKKYPDQYRININDLNFKTDADLMYFQDRIDKHFTRIPHASVYDIQLFKKRLNTYIKREITGTYSNFRSAIVSELGGQTFRPHYHGILYFDDERIVSRLQDLVDRAWRDKDNIKLGHSKAAPDRGEFASYLAKYICKPADLPSFYAHPALRPFFLTSRKPAIGSLFESSTEIRRIFDDASPKRVEFVKQGELWCPKVLPIGQSFENRLFPKCFGYDKISDYERRQLYKCAIVSNDILPYDKWISYFLRNRVLGKIGNSDYVNLINWCISKVSFNSLIGHYFSGDFVLKDSDFARLIYSLSRQFDSSRFFEQLYCVSRRVFFQSKVFNVSVDYYIDRVLEYHNINKPQFLLSRFYDLQNEVLLKYPGYDYRYFYPLTYLRDGFAPNKAPDALLYFVDQKFKYNEAKKTKDKNDYLESKLIFRDPVLYEIIKDYNYAKECYEDAQAIA